MNVIGIGVDLVYLPKIKRIYSIYQNRFLVKVFHPKEVSLALKRKEPSVYLASSFAAKEAFYKALGGYQPFIWKEISLLRDLNSGKPLIEIEGRALEVFKKRGGKECWVSLSHEKDYVVCMLVITGCEEELVCR
ncbi:holo-ACP synthase [Thermodesulfobacterium sp. TA1]|uniref:holo-ACP synthase n=1 Tax=Thermodesulfobacterium sp. TA1 TaxID=2234087 RepID=UPI00123216F3|nr:holo-ACP synthase [Thermodesulfobacterium sp. TA1]QER42417.1 holo-ACP synthase [Thermodesulfobacterium sp. TA1]